ncbi:MAG: HAD-IC family P-type ATPase [Acidimicrobiia bacterium]|nr:HAD-IC family P-type ATPase [Acidimicrobiia bacterium]
MTDAAPDLRGLTSDEVDQRVAEGRTNDVPDAPVRTTGQILRANIFNPVNAIISVLFVLIMVAGYPKDGLFVGVVFSNVVIGVYQEVKARRTLHELEVLNAPKARVIRNGIEHDLNVSEVVADELLVLGSGDQLVVDGEVVRAVGLELDESLLTGEADPVDKGVGDQVMSGSFVSAGSGHYRATRIGAEAYASQLAEEARVFKMADSELRRGVNVILRWLTVIIPPVAILLFWRLLDAEDQWPEALQGTVAAAVAMVPDGLVLLTSLAFITGVVALARRQALAKELASVELLARVDTLCLDKTGTITTGDISFGGLEAAGGTTLDEAGEAVGAIAGTDSDPNATMAAIAGAHPVPPDWTATAITPFSSARKWAGASFEGRGSYYIGAAEILADPDDQQTLREVGEHSRQGRRVLLVVRSDQPFDDDRLVVGRRAVALVLLEDTVRDDAPEILEYFRQQGVDLKVISGDNPDTVAAVARRAGVPGADEGTDARGLPDDIEGLADALIAGSVFGRVTPHQKRAMVGALQSRGRVVAMTGDGVNDVLALKDADMGIAMGSGSSSTRAVAQLVLLDNRFSTLPRVLDEGRRVINNIERVSNLFITKASYAVLITALVALSGSPFPFLPRQLTLIGTFSIGVPGFFLALAPNTALVRPGFLERVLRFSLPAGAFAGAFTVAVYEIVRRMDSVDQAEARTAATMCLLFVGLVTLVVISRPLRAWKVALAGAMAASYVVVLLWPFARDYFELDIPPTDAMWVIAAGSVAAAVGVVMTPRLFLPDD